VMGNFFNVGDPVLKAVERLDCSIPSSAALISLNVYTKELTRSPLVV
jgi:hypothetical protein